MRICLTLRRSFAHGMGFGAGGELEGLEVEASILIPPFWPDRERIETPLRTRPAVPPPAPQLQHIAPQPLPSSLSQSLTNLSTPRPVHQSPKMPPPFQPLRTLLLLRQTIPLSTPLTQQLARQTPRSFTASSFSSSSKTAQTLRFRTTQWSRNVTRVEARMGNGKMNKTGRRFASTAPATGQAQGWLKRMWESPIGLMTVHFWYFTTFYILPVSCPNPTFLFPPLFRAEVKLSSGRFYKVPE
jgi:hypothetical protein